MFIAVSLLLHVLVLNDLAGPSIVSGRALNAPPTLVVRLKRNKDQLASAKPIVKEEQSKPINNKISSVPEMSKEESEGIISTIHYYRREELDQAPRPVTQPDFEEIEAVVQEPGEVDLRLYINAMGEVNKVDVLNYKLPLELLQKLQTTFYATKFEPGMLDDEPVPSQLRIEVEIKPASSISNIR